MPLPSLSGARPESLTDTVARHLRAAVRDGTLEPGRLYSAYQLADQFGVSRSPVREALLRLAEVGLVRFERNRGFRVLVPGPEDVAEVFAVRLALEVPAARRAARQADAALDAALAAELAGMRAATTREAEFGAHDRRLHALLMEAAGNRRAAAIVAGLRDVTRLLGASTTAGSLRTPADVAAEHEPLLAAVGRRDPAAAAAAMTAHLNRTGRLLVSQAVADQRCDLDPDTVWAAVAG